MHRALTTLLMIAALGLGEGAISGDAGKQFVDAATFDARDRLILPTNLDQWIFIGSSLGMGYSQADFDPDSPGMFQIVRMEPKAYKAFVETGTFVDGTMFSLHFYGSQNKISINRAGFVMGDLHMAEIHLKDSKRFPDGFNFYTFNNDQSVAEAVPLPNECVSCHKKDGAYDGVFVQFYPIIHDHLPPGVLEKVAADASSH